MSKAIRIAGKNDFTCPLGWTIEVARNEIRLSYPSMIDGRITNNGIATRSSDKITSDGNYEFVDFRIVQSPQSGTAAVAALSDSQREVAAIIRKDFKMQFKEPVDEEENAPVALVCLSSLCRSFWHILCFEICVSSWGQSHSSEQVQPLITNGSVAGDFRETKSADPEESTGLNTHKLKIN